MNKKIGIVVDNLGAGQIAFEVINAANSFAENNNDCCCVFQLEYTPACIKPNIMVVNSAELFGFSGCAVSTSLESSKWNLAASGNGPRIFYVFDLFWLRKDNIYDDNIKVLSNPELLLVCRSEDHRAMLENYTNRSVTVMPFDIKALIDLGYRLGSYNRTIPEWISKIPEI